MIDGLGFKFAKLWKKHYEVHLYGAFNGQNDSGKKMPK